MIETKDLPPSPDRTTIRRALISVSDKQDVVPFAKRLCALGIEILSTGGTARALREANLPVTNVSEVTDFPKILGGRVKSLHPTIHGGILARRTDEADRAELDRLGIAPIDLVVVNLYPFRKAVARKDVTDALATENIDIGGPTMLRAAAKNFAFVAAVVDPDDYEHIVDELEINEGTLSLAIRRELATRAFQHTADYDAAIAGFLLGKPNNESSRQDLPETLSINRKKSRALRYGENPHQEAALYGEPVRYRKLHGKDLSFNNLLDLSAALNLIAEFSTSGPTLAILKHTNPCGVGQASTLAESYQKAFATDRQSPFGGIVITNRPLDQETAEAIDQVFTEIILAPAYENGVLDFLKTKKNRRLLEIDLEQTHIELDLRSAADGILAQVPDPPLPAPEELRDRCTVATVRKPSATEWADLDFAWRVCKHVKSNAIVYARNGATLGIGAGQMSRIDSSELAIAKGKKSGLDFQDCVVASDAFFPFADGLLAADDAGATAVIQPGGSIRDEEVIQAADDRTCAMVFTGQRHFRH